MNKSKSSSNGKRISMIALNIFFFASLLVFAIGDPERWQPVSKLSQEAYRGRTKQLALLIKEGNDVNQRDPDGKTPLMWAALGAEFSGVALLVNSGADINLRDHNGLTALMLVSGVRDTFRENISWAKKGGLSFLTKVFRKQAYLKTAKLLIEAGAEIEARDSNWEATALMFAAMGSDPKYVRFLFDQGATLTVRDDQAKVMIRVTNIEILRILVTSGVDINVQNADGGWNALLFACHLGNEKLARELIKYGANVNVVFVGQGSIYKAYTPLRFAEEGNHYKIVEMLKAAGAMK